MLIMESPRLVSAKLPDTGKRDVSRKEGSRCFRGSVSETDHLRRRTIAPDREPAYVPDIRSVACETAHLIAFEYFTAGNPAGGRGSVR